MYYHTPLQSVTQWETSYFGGYYKVLEDHPEIELSEKIRVVPNPDSEDFLFDDLREKLLKLFIHTISKEKLTNKLLYNSKFSEPFELEGKYWVSLSKDSIDLIVNLIIGKRKEISLMFQYYKNTITESNFLFEVEPPKDKKPNPKIDSPGGQKDDHDLSQELQKLESGSEFTEPKSSLAVEISKEVLKSKIKKYGGLCDSNENLTGKLKEKTEFVYVSKSNEICNYTQSEIKNSNSLCSLLDISFDTKEAKLENLMCGKMSSHKIAEVQAGNSRVYHKIEDDMETKPFTICVLGDESGSMTGGNDRQQNEIFKTLYRTFSQMLPQDKMFFYGHSGYADNKYPEVRVYHEPNYPFFENTINNQLNNDYNENYDGPVIEKIYERVRSITNDNIIFIVVSDGSPSGCGYGGTNDRENMKRIIEKCNRDGFVTIGIGLRYNGVENLYKYHTVVDYYEDKDSIRKISQLVNNVVKIEFQS